jgi:protein CpxP
MRAKNIFLAAVVSLNLLGVSAFALAHEHGPMEAGEPPFASEHEGHEEGGHKNRADFMAKQLGLTPEQQKTLEAYHASQENSMKEQHKQLREAREALRKAGPSADDATLNALAANLSTLIAQQEIAHIKMQRKLLEILTPKQKEKFAEMKANHDARPPRRDHEMCKGDAPNKKV